MLDHIKATPWCRTTNMETVDKKGMREKMCEATVSSADETLACLQSVVRDLRNAWVPSQKKPKLGSVRSARVSAHAVATLPPRKKQNGM